MAGATIDMAELRELCWAEQAGELSPEAAARLEQLVTGSSAACNYYTHYVSFCAHLEWSATPCDEVCDRVVGKVDQAPSPAALPLFSFLGDSVHAALATVPQGWLLAYLIATVIFGVGLLVGSLIPVSSSEQVAKSVPSANESIAGPEMQSVGRITGLIDCRWVDPDSAAVGYAAVPFGRRYALASGLMEITYDAGARVILQGPVTYEIDSRHGGYLSAGKLTARLETNDKRGTPNAERSASSSSFSVRTPTATVTDLGTEFGVEVEPTGATSASVFRGVIEVQSIAGNGQHGHAIRLSENESGRVEKDSSGRCLIVRRGAADPAAFVRVEQFPKAAEEHRLKAFRRWQAYGRELRHDPSLLAYYDFQERDGQPSLLFNAAANGDRACDGVVENAAWSDGRMPGKHALLFQNPGDCVRLNLPQATADLTLAAWVSFDAFSSNLRDSSGLLISEDQNPPAGIRWQVWHRDGALSFSSPGDSIAASPAINYRVRQWTHLASVYDWGKRRVEFFVNGRSVGSDELWRNGSLAIGPAWIGNRDSQASQATFKGRMDELVVVGRPLTADEIRHMYTEGQPQADGRFASQSLVRPPAKVVGADEELIRNGGFEDARPSGVDGGWYHDVEGWDVVRNSFQAFTGLPHGGKFRAAAWEGGIGAQTHWYSNGFAPNVTRLTFRGWAKAENAGGAANVSVTVGNLTGETLTVHDARSFTVTDTTWTKLAGELTIRHGSGTDFTNYVEVRAAAATTGPNSPVQFDDLSLVTVEKEP